MAKITEVEESSPEESHTKPASSEVAKKTKRPLIAGKVGFLALFPILVLALAWIVGFCSRLFAVVRFEAIIHEFDPWFNYRATHYMVKNGFYNFLNWFDERAWYPLGRIVGGTVYPGLMITSGAIHYALSLLNIPVHIRDICVFLAPIFSGLTAIATFLLTRELWSTGAGLFAACFIAIVPGYISRSVAGSYDNEGIAIFALIFVYYLWVKSVSTGSVYWSALSALAYFYMVSAWGGYVFIINLIPLHVFVLLLMGRFTSRIYVAYSTFFILGLILSMQIPFVGFQPIRTSEHMAAAGVFALLQAYAFLKYIQRFQKHINLWLLAGGAAGAVFAVVVGLTALGYIAPWSGRFYSLWDTGYAKIHIPIIASVSEHQPTTWTSFFFDLHVLVCLYPVGAYYCIKNINDVRVFIVLYAATASYFAGVMIRLMLTLTPVVCILAGIALSQVMDSYLMGIDGSAGASTTDTTVSEASSSKKSKDRTKSMFDEAGKAQKTPAAAQLGENDPTGIGISVRNIVTGIICILLVLFAVHCTWVTSNAYSSPSIVLATYGHDGSRNILDDFREAYYWLWQNTEEKATVMSWWDYGYQIAGMGNRTTIVDNNTWNNSHIALVGKAMSSNETAAYKIMRELDVDYVLVIFGGIIGYSGDDINKFLWMVRIAEGEHPAEIRETDYFSPDGHFRVDSGGSKTLLNCLMYKLSYYRFGEIQLGHRQPFGYDRARGVEIGNKDIKLEHLEEAFTSEHWLVRIYKVKKEKNHQAVGKRVAKVRRVITQKSARRQEGVLKKAKE
ncbi:dolichyl-diphosphooligosaccharide--protein glycosyltransferase subunit STT3B-like [Paramacrobiotus metropolitanus]|uniref:dolichyl-diphosphooligosaccharide--protein glycosyltransferase subunit STT3B-like n=1 Tax=Paramacrobiotus metropolitanus TaxID=2943436 RepID=UPI00244617E1|nr:dolichyl-diphosphooligosaccharide--protein glycosyltransferase subunit STT3B-like [Paramacrobiotus metropolitanus]